MLGSVGIAHHLPLQSLGPFKGVPIEWDSIGLDAMNIMETQGGEYSSNLQSECLQDIVQPHFEEHGRLSPSSYISLTGTQRAAASVPELATHYAFAYPLPGFCDTGSIPLTDFRYCFLALGGFIYFGRGGHICGVNALTLGDGLFFEGPYALKSATLRSYLYDAGRVEEATMQSLIQCNIVGFCWVTPGESFKRFTGESDAHRVWPSGAFVYLVDEKIPESVAHQDFFFRVTSKKPRTTVTAPIQTETTAPIKVGTSDRDSDLNVSRSSDRVALDHAPLDENQRLRDEKTSPEIILLNDAVSKAEAHCLLMRCLDESWTVKVIGGGAGKPGFYWYRRKEDVDHRCARRSTIRSFNEFTLPPSSSLLAPLLAGSTELSGRRSKNLQTNSSRTRCASR